ncbi:MAG: NUDIX hydrolase [Myxococcota bacterium]
MTTRKRLLTGPRISVDRVTVDTPAGPVARDVVVHPGAVVILPVLEDGRFVLIRNRRVAVGETLLELPAGTLTPGEAPATCARRELAEETGYRARALAPLLTFYPSPGVLDEVMHGFVASGLEPGAQDLDAGEEIDVEVMDRAALDQALESGAIKDGKTLTLLLWWERFGAP